MDQYGQLPLTMNALFERLRKGQTFAVAGSENGLEYALYLDAGEHIILRQGSQEQVFRQLEPAVLTILNCLGDFSLPKP